MGYRVTITPFLPKTACPVPPGRRHNSSPSRPVGMSECIPGIPLSRVHSPEYLCSWMPPMVFCLIGTNVAFCLNWRPRSLISERLPIPIEPLSTTNGLLDHTPLCVEPRLLG